MAQSAFNQKSFGIIVASGLSLTTPNILYAETYLSFSYPDPNEYQLDAASLGSIMSDVNLKQTTPTLTFGIAGEGILHPFVQFNIMGHRANIIHNETESARPSDRLARNINKRKNRILDGLGLDRDNEWVERAYNLDAGTPVGDYLYNQLNTTSASDIDVVTVQFVTGVASEFNVTDRLSFGVNAGVGIMAQYWSDKGTSYQLMAVTRFGYDFHPTDSITVSSNLYFGGGVEYAQFTLSNSAFKDIEVDMIRPLIIGGIGVEATYNLSENLSFNGSLDTGLLYQGAAIYGGEDINFGLGDKSQTNAVVQAGLKIEYRF